nr:hypothetical protein [Streptomyces sp. RG38]
MATRTRTAERYARGLAAAVAAVACLFLAGTAGQSRTAEPASPAAPPQRDTAPMADSLTPLNP